MSRRHGLARALVALALAVAGLPAVGAAQAVPAEPLALDAHLDLPADFATEKNDPGVDGRSQVDLPKMTRGTDAAVFAVFAWQRRATPDENARAVEIGAAKLRAIERMVEWYPSRVGLARTAADVARLHAEGRRAVIVGVLNATVLGENAERLDDYHARGLRQLGFVHAGHNAYADSDRPLPQNGDAAVRWNGLSPLGRRLVPRLNDLGIVIDVSQLSPAALRQVVESSRAPVIASHSGVKGRVDTPRNLGDEELRLIAGTGGVVHVVAFSAYLVPPDPGVLAAQAALRREFGVQDDAGVAQLPAERQAAYQERFRAILRTAPRATVRDLVDSIDYVVKTIGVEHVGIASDFEHGGGITGFAHAGEADNVTAELRARGYAEADIARIWSGNYLRVLAAAEARSAAATDGASSAKRNRSPPNAAGAR